MPYSTIDKPSKYFNTKLYTGTGATQSITGLNFKPDWVWIKDRTTAYNHYLYDIIRTPLNVLQSNATDANVTQTDGLSAFNSDGFTVLNNRLNVNASGDSFVSWNWLGANTTVSNTAGTISSTVSANTTSGFSIVSFTSQSSGSATIGHGLGVAPKFIITKLRDSADNWRVYHSSLGNTNHLRLNLTDAVQSAPNSWNSTSPTSTVFTLGTTFAGSYNMIAYCFAEVKGFSKAFSYTGNGSADGTYVNLGFRPSWLLIKRTDSAGYDWLVYDNKRQVEYNVVDDFLKPNLSDAETTGNAGQSLDFLSNGIKFRGTGASSNASGGTYIGFAIAENPFVSSKGIPVTAR